MRQRTAADVAQWDLLACTCAGRRAQHPRGCDEEQGKCAISHDASMLIGATMTEITAWLKVHSP